MFQLELDAATKRFGALAAVDGVSAAVAEGEFLAVLGPSGCGKTTLLRLVAGFEALDGGTIRIAGREVAAVRRHVPPEERRVGVVFQSYALWPHMDVARNVGYALETARLPAPERHAKVAEALAAAGLAGFEARRPAELSGGQRQRVALARCLAMQARLVLLDEPLANLDMHLRAAMMAEFRAFHARTGAAMVYITHDQAEAMALAHRIAVMERGRVVQIGAPEIIYREPAAAFVAGFVGRGAVVPCTVLAASRNAASTGLFGAEATLRCAPDQKDGAALACLRPEELMLVGESEAGAFSARIAAASYRGGHYEIDAVPEVPDGAAPPVLRLDVAAAPPKPGERVRIAVRGGWIVPG